jgi:hypothetical protein
MEKQNQKKFHNENKEELMELEFVEFETTSDSDTIVVFFPNFNEITRRQRK